MKRARRGRGREAFLDSIVNLSKDKKRWLQRQYCATNVDFHSRLLYRARSDCATVIIRSMSPYICFVRVVKAVKVSLCETQVLRHIIALRNIVSNLWNCRNKLLVTKILIWFMQDVWKCHMIQHILAECILRVVFQIIKMFFLILQSICPKLSPPSLYCTAEGATYTMV